LEKQERNYWETCVNGDDIEMDLEGTGRGSKLSDWNKQKSITSGM
jgi:hypothetical protein